MQSLGRVLAATPAWDDKWYGNGGQASTAGPRVDMDSSLSWSGLYAAVSYVAEDTAKLPLVMYERVDRGKQAARDHYLYEKLHDQPNTEQTALEFREMATAFAILRGAGHAELVGRGRELQIVPLHPDLVKRDPTGSGIRYTYRDPKTQRDRTILGEDMLVLKGRLGRGVLDIGLETIGLQLAIQRHAGTLFSRGARHSGVVSRPADRPFPNDKVREAFRQALAEYASGGPRAGRPLLLEDGMTWENASMTAQESELLGQMRWGVAEASRLTRIPPHKLMELERSTNNNIDRQSIDYVVDTLLGWCKRWEQVIYRDLLKVQDRGRYFAEHILDALLQGDPEARSKAYSLAVQWGWMTRNEVREKENMNTLAGLDAPLTPLNMTTDASGQTKVVGYAPTGSPMVAGQLRLLAADAASRIVRREIAAVTKVADRAGGDRAAFQAGVDAFYAEHGREVAEALHVPEHEARRYAKAQRAEVLADGIGVMDQWLVDRVDHLTSLAMNQPELRAAA